MDLSGYAELAVRLANAAGDEQEAVMAGDGQGISTPEGLRSLLTGLGFPDSPVTRADLDAMRALGTEFRKIFAGSAAGNGSEAVDRLNALLIRHPVHPQILRHDDQPWHLHLTESGSVTDMYAAGAAMGLAMVITQSGIDHLGTCTAPSCQRVFVDASMSRSQLYCSDRCASRASVPALKDHRRARAAGVRPKAAV